MRALVRFFGIVVTLVLAVDTGVRGDAAPPHLQWAERLVSEVAPADNFYGSHPTIVRWAEAGNNARNRSVCSSFVTHVLERAYGLHAADIERWFGTSNPQAIDYERAIAAANGFALVSAVRDVRPGDVLAVSYGAGHKPTGHVMIADGTARLHRSSRPLETGLTQYEIAVIDSSHSYHGFRDTRLQDGGAQVTGVGRGTLRLYAAAGGRIAGYAWSSRSNSEFYSVSSRPFVIGRYTGSPGSATPASKSDADNDATDTGEI